jgi:hypothetical protein
MAFDVGQETYIVALQRIVSEIHGCASVHFQTVRVREVIVEKVVWEGDVEVFAVLGHPRAQRCFAWVLRQASNGDEVRFFAVLETSVVRTPLDAIKFARVAHSADLIHEYSRLCAPV